MKYEPLGAWLATQPSQRTEISLRFTEIERIIGGKLPQSACNYRQWWANQEYGSQAPHWQRAGFLIDAVDLSRKIVRFRRHKAAG